MGAGLVEGEELCMDATRVDANASVHTMRTRFSVVAAKEHVEKVFAENPTSEEPAPPRTLTEAQSIHPQLASVDAPESVEPTEPERTPTLRLPGGSLPPRPP